MKRCLLIAMIIFAGMAVFAQETPSETVYAEKKWPSAKRPQTPSSEKLREAAEKNIENATDEYVEETRDTFS